MSSRGAAPVLLLCSSACFSSAVYAPPAEDPPPADGLRPARPVAFTPEDDLAPSASRDGRFLAFASEQNGNLDVWIRDWGTNSTYPITLNSAEDFDPAISPDNQRVAFISRRDDAKGDVFITSITTAGSGLERLTDAGTYDRQPIFSPDGARIYYTSAVGIGTEFVTVLDLETRIPRRVSPTPGFDAAPSPDGRYLVYTAPRGVGTREHPHLIALRLSDSATRALTRSERPEGFARFIPDPNLVPGARHALAYVRFPDDDNDDGVVDARDQASLWRLDLDLDALFATTARERPEPRPLTDGSTDDLFPDAQGPWVYFTQGDRQQDILRLPNTGIYPVYEDPAEYVKLGIVTADPRTRWFAFRYAVAVCEPGSILRAQALLRIGNIQLERERPDLAREAFSQIAAELHDAGDATPEGEIAGLARVELASLARSGGLANAPRPIDRERVLRATQVELDALSARYSALPRITARVDLELAEVLVDRGERTRAIEAFENVVREHRDQPFSAARAMLRRIELLGIAHDPDALGEAYAHVLERFPTQREAVNAASERIVGVQLEGLAANSAWRARVDALSRLIPRYGDSPVRSAARWRLAGILRERGALEDAALQLERLVVESADDRLSAARALEELATIDEERGRLDAALESWMKLRGGYRDLPGYDARARDAITRVGARKAALEEEKGDKQAARAAYASIIDNDITQVKAHRRYLALSAETGTVDEAIEKARLAADRSRRTPIARWAYGLALTWKSPPDLEDALPEIEAALELNPQFTHAYITRGWILEMQELERPGAFGRVWNTIVRSANTAIGGIFDVEISEPDRLLQAIDDYTRARQLNPESEDPDTEAEILLDDGNARYRLGDKTNDVGLFKTAFTRYVDCLNLGYRFHSPLTELVFFERLGRAAAWSEEWAISTMATRRAIALAKAHNQTGRLAQLYANLSLAYDQAGEDAYAAEALAQSSSMLEERKLEERLLVARRNRAASKLENVLATPELLDSALDDLSSARALLENVEIAHDDAPIWRAAVDDASSAQYGFGSTAELDVNVALAEGAHRALGDLSRARALRERRRALTQEVLEAIPRYAFLVREEPVTLLMVRERLGLFTTAAREHAARGDLPRAEALLASAREELDAWIDNAEMARDRGALLRDRARLAALDAELYARFGSPDPAREGVVNAGLLAALEDLDEALLPPGITRSSSSAPQLVAAARAEDEVLASLPQALSSTAALARTATVALSVPRLEGQPRYVRAVRARVLYAKGLMALRAAPREVPGDPRDFAARLGALDASIASLDLARLAFEQAAREAAGAGFGLGSRVLALAVDASAAISRTLRDREETLVNETAKLAVELARASGREDFALRFELADAVAREDVARIGALLEKVQPRRLAGSLALARTALARSASAALARGELAEAITALDRAMLLETAISPHPGSLRGNDADDRAFAVGLAQAFEALAARERALAATEASTPPETFRALRRGVEAAAARITELRGAGVSAAAQARAFADPVPFELVLDGLELDEVMLVLAPIDGVAHVFLADGSTTAPPAEKLRHRDTGVDAGALAADVAALRGALARNLAPDPAVAARVKAAVVGPYAEVLAQKSTLIVADLLAGGPIPRIVFAPEATAIVHVSSPTALSLARDELIVGVEGTVAVAAGDGTQILPAQHRLGFVDAAAFRRAAAVAPDDSEKKGRSLDERSARELLEDRAQRLVIVEAPLALEPGALERSVAILGAAPEGPAGELDEEELQEHHAKALLGEVDRFEQELPLEAIDIPARTLILARVLEQPAGNVREEVRASDALRLDLVLAARGYATVIVVPEAVPRDVSARVLAAFAATEDEKGPARALAEAIAAESSPAAALITAIGAPGLDRDGVKAFAKKALKSVQPRASNAFKKGQYAQAAVAFERLVRLLREAGDDKQLPAAYTLLVKTLVDLQPVSDPARGADVQIELVRYLESRPRSPANEKLAANAKVDLGRIYGLAGDHVAAETTLRAAIEELGRLGDRLNVARAWFVLGQHFERDRNDFKQAAALIEQAISVYEAEKAFAKKPPDDAARAVRSIGAIYLNRLSDPARAQAAYERALRYAQTADEKNLVVISLARVARRRGDPTRAAELAEQARATALETKRGDLEADALIEAANVAWVQGDYRRGQDLCAESLAKVQALKVEQRRRRKIYALSVCGLIAMSRREFALATDYLERARGIAESIRDSSEIATQWNNLGRVYLEFGRVAEAINAFQRALEIDEGLRDRFALAYDLRNLGTALAYQKRYDEAERTLLRGLEYAVQVQDANNELRARFALAEMARDRGDAAGARAAYAEALPLAENLDVKDLAWQIRRALGLLFVEEGKLAEAEAELRKAVQIARSITGRSAATDFGPHRYAAFDDLVDLLLSGDRVVEAFQTADLARSLEQTELLDDSRIRFASKDVARLLREAREARTATAAEAALVELKRVEPHLAELLEPASPEALAAGVPEDAALIVYRVADEEVVAFVVDRRGVQARRTAIAARVLGDAVRDYGRALVARADVSRASSALAEVLIDPVRDLVATKKRLAIVPHRWLRYVAFPALPFGASSAEVLVDRFVIVQSLDPLGAVAALARPLGPVAALPIVAVGASGQAVRRSEPPLPFARKELELIGEEYPRAQLHVGERATTAALVGSLKEATGVLHFAGHSRLGAAGEGGESYVDPLGGELRTIDGAVSLLDVLGADTRAELVVLSACSSMLARAAGAQPAQVSGDEILSLAEAFHIAGADNVLATTMHVHDIAAAMVMKRFYRAARRLDAASALREAQLEVRRWYPHPAWWATFVLLGR